MGKSESGLGIEFDGATIHEYNLGNNDIGLKIEEKRSPLSEALTGGDLSDNKVTTSISAGIGLAGIGVSYSFDRKSGTITVEVHGSLFGGSIGFGVASNPKNGISMDSFKAGLGGTLGLQVSVLGSKFGAIAKAEGGLSFDARNGTHIGFNGSSSVGLLGLGEVDAKGRFGKTISDDWISALGQPGKSLSPAGSPPPTPLLSFGSSGSDRDKAPPPSGTPTGTPPLSFTPPPSGGGRTPPPSWANPGLPLSLGTPVSDRDRPPFLGLSLGEPARGGGNAPPRRAGNDRQRNRNRTDLERDLATVRRAQGRMAFAIGLEPCMDGSRGARAFRLMLA
jgi:hypothetical protein